MWIFSVILCFAFRRFVLRPGNTGIRSKRSSIIAFAMVNEVATDAPLTKFIYTSREVAAGGSHALICHPAVEDLKSQFPGATIC